MPETHIAKLVNASKDEGQIVQGINKALLQITARKDRYIEHASIMRALIAAGEARRLGRTDDLSVAQAAFNGRAVEAKIVGSKGRVYNTRVTLSPRGHQCNCRDWQIRGRSVGPCKHVLVLGQYWLNERVIPRLEDLQTGLISIL
jgi:hypothetical protein